MKKQFTILSGFFLFTGITLAQNAGVSPDQVSTKNTITPYNGEVKSFNSLSEKALGVVLWQSDFSNSAVWSTTTDGQGTFEIGTQSAQMTPYMGAMASTTAANGFGFFNGIQYLLTGSAAPQNTSLITETLDLTGNEYVEFSFQQRYRRFNSDELYVEFSADGGATWPTSQRVNTNAVGNGPSLQNTLSLIFQVNDAANARFRFRWFNSSTNPTGGSGYGWCVDDVKISSLADYELVNTYGFNGVSGYKYTQIPSAQVSPILFRAGIKNQGSEELTGVKLVVSATTPTGTTSFESTERTIASQAVDTLDATYTANDGTGTYSFTQTIVLNETDDVPSNNGTHISGTTQFRVTDWVYGIDSEPFGGVVDSFDFGAYLQGADFSGLGVSFDVFANQDLHGADIRLYTGTAMDAEFAVRVHEYNPAAGSAPELWGTTGTPYLAESELFIVGDLLNNDPSGLNSTITVPDRKSVV